MYFSKKSTRSVQWGLGQNPETGEFSRIFVKSNLRPTVCKVTVKSNLTDCKATFNCQLPEKLGEQDVLVAAPIILLGEQRSRAWRYLL